MEKALRLLIYTDKPIKEIAYKAGYEDEAYFSRMFSKIYQESPGRYRKRNQNRLP
jgi:AraC-like DNA-binding protein